MGERAGFWAAIVLAVSIGPYLFTRILIPDMLIALWLMWGLDFFLRSLKNSPPRSCRVGDSPLLPRSTYSPKD